MGLWRHQYDEVRLTCSHPIRARFWEPRTGKTRTCVREITLGPYSRILIVCPKTVAGVWAEEFRFAELPYHDLSDGPIGRRVLPKGAGIVIVNYDALPKMLPDLLKWKPQYIVADESHLIKTASAKRSRALHKLGDVAQFRRILTGTPDPKNFEDYFSQYRFLDSSLFGKKIGPFRARYLIQHPVFPSKIIGYRNLDELREKILSRASRVRRADCMDLPDIQEIHRHVELPPAARKVYDDLVRTSVAEIEGQQVSAPHILSKLMRLQQVTSGFLPTDDGIKQLHDVKINAVLGELSEPLEAGQKVVVFCRFREEQRRLVDAIHTEYPAVIVWSLNGDSPANARDAIARAFGPPSAIRPSVLVAQIETGSLGISLAAADMAIFTSFTFDTSDFYQARDRIWKPNGKLVYVYVTVPKTIDAMILSALEHKRSMSQVLLDVGFARAAQGDET